MAVEMGKLLGNETQRRVFDYLVEKQRPVTMKELQDNLLEVSISKTPTRYGEIVRVVSNLESNGFVTSDYIKNAPDENGTSTAQITEYGLKVHKFFVGTSAIIRK